MFKDLQSTLFTLYGRMFDVLSHVTTKRKNSMLNGWADKGSDWKNTSHVIGDRFI